MASLISCFLLIFYSTSTIVVSSKSRCGRYKSIISFGDSIADTGNHLRLSDVKNLPPVAFLPYGKSFFHPPSGRVSDGRLIIDFIAEFLGLPYVLPYFRSQNVSFNQGIDFTVYGAIALDREFLVKQGIKSDFTNISLTVQLNTFKQDLIDLGEKTFLLPGNFPVGCSTAYLTLFQTAKIEHDPFTGCIPWLNKFEEHHNEQLKTELKRLQNLYLHVNIIYADYYNSLNRFFQEPAKCGFRNRPLAACCGVEGQYNFTIDEECGHSYCQNPSEYMNWDGYHLTEATHQTMAQGILNSPYANPAFNWSCFGTKLVNKEGSSAVKIQVL